MSNSSLYKCRRFSCFLINTDVTFASNLLPVEYGDDRSPKTRRMKTDCPAAKCAAGAGAAPSVCLQKKPNQIKVSKKRKARKPKEKKTQPGQSAVQHVGIKEESKNERKRERARAFPSAVVGPPPGRVYTTAVEMMEQLPEIKPGLTLGKPGGAAAQTGRCV